MSSDALERITALANIMVEQQRAVERFTTELAAAKEALARTETEDLPELMTELELLSITLENGAVVEVKKDVQCGISEARRPAAHAWLNEHGFGGLIKTELVVEFDRGEHELAEEMAERISSEFERAAVAVESVHPATLKAFIKEQLEKGAELPADLFGIFPFNRAKVTPPKPAKAKKSKKG